MTNATDKLLPCPFCGSNEVAIRKMPHGFDCPEYAAQCRACLTINGTSLSELAAVKAWNTRHNPDANALKIAVEALMGISEMSHDEAAVNTADNALAEINRIAENGE